ncbi:MAG: pirin family protein [Saprospiraceae bacterium]|nr:pirin family protein [Candidatus Vicinibacter affinis]
MVRFTFTELAPALHQGVGPHPHRGFSPVTFVVDGEVHHRDSRGNSQIAHKGDVQWLNAGAALSTVKDLLKNCLIETARRKSYSCGSTPLLQIK